MLNEATIAPGLLESLLATLKVIVYFSFADRLAMCRRKQRNVYYIYPEKIKLDVMLLSYRLATKITEMPSCLESSLLVERYMILGPPTNAASTPPRIPSN